MKDNFDAAFAVELKFEGGDVNNPKDPGGATRQGITQATYTAYRRSLKQPPQSVFSMTDAERDAIYRKQYADVIHFDDLPAGLDLCVLDFAVNSGNQRATKTLQRALGSAYTGTRDGIMGVKTLAALAAINDVDSLIAMVCSLRLAFMKALKTWSTFGRGWLARVTQVETIAQSWATGTAGPAPVFVPDMHRQALITDAKTIPSAAPGTGIATAGPSVAAATTVATTYLAQAKDHLSSLASVPGLNGLASSVSAKIDHAATVLTTGSWFLGTALLAAGGAWAWYANRRSAELHDALDLPNKPAATLPAAS